MMLIPSLRRFVFTTHISSSLGWLGAVLVFLALGIVGLTSREELTVRGVYLVMAPAAWLVLVPLAHASLVSGIVLALATPWGVFRHYWVTLKLAMTAFATFILVVYMDTFRHMAGVARDPMVDPAAVRNPSPAVHSLLALGVLVAATVLSVYKPFGLTPHGERAPGGQRGTRRTNT